MRFLDAPSERLKAAALDLRQRLSRFEGVSAIDDDFPYGRQELLLELTPLGTALGFTTEGVGRQLRHAFEGAIAKRFPRGDEEVLIRVSLPQDEDAPVDMRGMRLVSPSGERVLLEEVVSLREQAGLAQVKHHDGARAVSVTASVNAAVTSSGEILAELEQEDLPEIVARYGVSYALGGRAEEQADTFADLGTGAALAAAMIFMVLAWVSKSYGRPIVVMSIIPFGIVGAVIGHMVMGYKLTILSLTALMGLAGILVNDSIILVTHIDNLIASGYQLREAVVQGVKDRLRAMLLTSLTTIFGLLPLLFETSLQAQFLIPMAVSLVWGVGLASILVLVLAPSILGIQEDFKRIGVYIWRGPARRAPAG